MSVLGPIVFISTFVTFCSVLCKDKTNTQANLITSVNSAWLLAKIGKGYSARIRHAHGKTLSHSVNSAWHLAQIGKVYSGRTSFPPTAVFPPCLCLFLYSPDRIKNLSMNIKIVRTISSGTCQYLVIFKYYMACSYCTFLPGKWVGLHIMMRLGFLSGWHCGQLWPSLSASLLSAASATRRRPASEFKIQNNWQGNIWMLSYIVSLFCMYQTWIVIVLRSGAWRV